LTYATISRASVFASLTASAHEVRIQNKILAKLCHPQNGLTFVAIDNLKVNFPRNRLVGAVRKIIFAPARGEASNASY
jgi:hypothetical protein